MVAMVPIMPGNPHECRENAKRCLELAEAAGTRTSRENFEGLAQTWMALATDYEATNVLLTSLSASSQDRFDQALLNTLSELEFDEPFYDVPTALRLRAA
jgi:hypothetical protein